MRKYKGSFYVEERIKNVNILKGDSRIVIDEKYFLAPNIETNIYKKPIKLLPAGLRYPGTGACLNSFVLDIYECENHKRFILTETGKYYNNISFKFCYNKDFIIFNFKTYDNKICQHECFTTKLPILSINKLEKNIKNKNFYFKLKINKQNLWQKELEECNK